MAEKIAGQRRTFTARTPSTQTYGCDVGRYNRMSSKYI